MRVGDKIETWFSDQEDHMFTIIAIEPYRGKYTEYFTHTLKVTAPRTKAKWLYICVDKRDTV